MQIGQVFIECKAKHVLCFDTINEEPHKSLDEENAFIQPRMNYIFQFCIEFYGQLAEGQTVEEAFKNAMAHIYDEQTLGKIWGFKEKN